MYRAVWLTYRQKIRALDYRLDPVIYWVLCIGQSDIRGVGLQVEPAITGYYVSDSLTNLPSDNRGVGLQVWPRHYWVLCIGQSDIRGAGLQVEPFITGYYVSDSLTYVPSENRDVGLQVHMTTVDY